MRTGDEAQKEFSSADVGLHPGRRVSKELIDRIFGIVSVVGILASLVFGILQQRLTNEANKITKEAYVATQRAFVTVNELQIFGEPDSPPEVPIWWSFRALAKNSGSTPTKNMTVNYQLLILEKGQIPRAFDALMPPSDPDAMVPNRSRVRLGANSTIPIGINGTARSAEHGNLSFPNGTAYNMQMGYTKAFYLGSIYYNDIFQNTEQHVTKFCFVIDAKISSHYSYLRPFNAGLCPYFNCSDDECIDDGEEFRVARDRALAQAKVDLPDTDELRWIELRKQLASIWRRPISYFPTVDKGILLAKQIRPSVAPLSPLFPILPELVLLRAEGLQ